MLAELVIYSGDDYSLGGADTRIVQGIFGVSAAGRMVCSPDLVENINEVWGNG